MAGNKKPRKKRRAPMTDREGVALINRVGGDTRKVTELDMVVNAYQVNCMRTIADIRRGSVAELDVDKLQNFMQTACVLMELAGLQTFREAQRIAELRHLMRYSPEGTVVMDPEKLNGAATRTDNRVP